MQELITSFIIQSKECKLPGIGMFRRITSPAETDIINHQITPPVVEYLFTGKEDKVSDELVQYVAAKKNISTETALSQIQEFCSQLRDRLRDDEEINMHSLGTLKKGGSGNIFFHRDQPFIFSPVVTAERVIHKNASHTMIVGDRETTSTAMNELLVEPEEEKKETWKITSIVLLCLGIIILIFYFYLKSFSSSALGKQGSVTPASPPEATYSVH